MTPMSLLAGLVFGAVGSVYIFRGRREHDPLYLLVGVALIVYPYFVASLALLIAVGVILVCLPVAHARGWFFSE